MADNQWGVQWNSDTGKFGARQTPPPTRSQSQLDPFWKGFTDVYGMEGARYIWDMYVIGMFQSGVLPFFDPSTGQAYANAPQSAKTLINENLARAQKMVHQVMETHGSVLPLETAFDQKKDDPSWNQVLYWYGAGSGSYQNTDTTLTDGQVIDRIGFANYDYVQNYKKYAMDTLGLTPYIDNYATVNINGKNVQMPTIRQDLKETDPEKYKWAVEQMESVLMNADNMMNQFLDTYRYGDPNDKNVDLAAMPFGREMGYTPYYNYTGKRNWEPTPRWAVHVDAATPGAKERSYAQLTEFSALQNDFYNKYYSTKAPTPTQPTEEQLNG